MKRLMNYYRIQKALTLLINIATSVNLFNGWNRKRLIRSKWYIYNKYRVCKKGFLNNWVLNFKRNINGSFYKKWIILRSLFCQYWNSFDIKSYNFRVYVLLFRNRNIIHTFYLWKWNSDSLWVLRKISKVQNFNC